MLTSDGSPNGPRAVPEAWLVEAMPLFFRAVSFLKLVSSMCRGSRKAADDLLVVCNPPGTACQPGFTLAAADSVACKQPAGDCA